MVANPFLRIEFVKVVNSEVFIRFVVAQNEINRNQNAVFDRTDCAFLSTAGSDTMIESFKITVLGPHGAVRYFGQGSIEVGICGRRFAGFPISANTALAPRSAIPGMASTCSTAIRNEGGATAPNRSLTLAISFSKKSYCPSNWRNKYR